MPKKVKPDPEAQTERIQIRASPRLRQMVEEWRATQRPIPSFSDALRILVETNPKIAEAVRDEPASGLEAEAQKKKGGRK